MLLDFPALQSSLSIVDNLMSGCLFDLFPLLWLLLVTPNFPEAQDVVQEYERRKEGKAKGKKRIT